jgi:hypothetical protein
MSMLGLSVGTTPRVLMSASLMKRVRMSLVFEATTKSAMGAPIRRAIHPDSTLPKLPVGTENDTSPRPASASLAVT